MTTKRAFWAAILVGLAVSAAQAMGRKPDDDDKDSFPDYNRIEMHPKPIKAQSIPSSEPDRPVPPPPKPPLNTPADAPGEDETVPKPPPKAVPLPSDSSEPPMPDDIISTATPTSTDQAPTDNNQK